MLRGTPAGRQVLLAHLQQLRGAEPVGPLLPKLQAVYPNPPLALAQHLGLVSTPAASLRPVVGRGTIP
jgi:hypothetical protein